MEETTVGKVVQIRHTTGKQLGKQLSAKVLASRAGSHLLVESMDGKFIYDVKPSNSKADTIFEVDCFCPIGPSGYTRDKAAKTLGYKGLKLH